MSEDFQILVNNIKHQFNLLSKTFFKLSTYLSQLNNYTPSALSTTNTSVSETNSTSFVKKKRLRSQKEKEKTKRILHNKIVGKILPVLCDKNGIKTRGYKVELQYYIYLNMKQVERDSVFLLSLIQIKYHKSRPDTLTNNPLQNNCRHVLVLCLFFRNQNYIDI